jgi:hypothetical protein
VKWKNDLKELFMNDKYVYEEKKAEYENQILHHFYSVSPKFESILRTEIRNEKATDSG